MRADKPGGTILIGFGESLSAPEVAWDLLDHGFQVSAFIRRGCSPPLRRIKTVKLVEVTAPEADAWEAVDQIGHAIQDAGARTMLPLDDASVWLCDKVSQRVSVPVAGPTGETARLALDKRLQLGMAQSAGFNVPDTDYIGEGREIPLIGRLPVVIKPAAAISETEGRLHRGPIFFCREREDLQSAARRCDFDGHMIVQPLLNGTGEGIFGIHGPGGVTNWSAHRRIRMMNPLGSGSSACRSLAVTDQPIRPAARMLDEVNWPGMFMIELLRDSSDQLWFMELNGRSWGSMALAIRQGLHYPAWAVMQALDPSCAPPETPAMSPVVCRHLGREIVHVLSVLKGKKEHKLIPGHSRMRTVREVCRYSRDDEWYNWRKGSSLLFWEDTVKTVLGKVLSRRGSN
jgi:biotin carboxylase